MIKLKNILEGSSTGGSYNADAGEPETGYLRGGDTRQLGMKAGKPEPWFEGGDYTQVDFPTADHIFGKGIKADFSVIKTILSDIKSIKLKNILKEKVR